MPELDDVTLHSLGGGGSIGSELDCSVREDGAVDVM